MCEYQGYEFGATYEDSVCIDGYLFDADSGETTGEDGMWEYFCGGDIPCPRCNAAKNAEYYRDEKHNYTRIDDVSYKGGK